MERSIRLGKDFNVRWSIHRVMDGERQPYELAGKELVLQYRTPYGLKEATEWKVVGNTIVWTFRGKEQKALGSYELILTENGGKDGMVTVDTCRAFKLVAHSCEETEGSGSDIVIEDVVLESEVTFAALRGPQGERGPEGPQGPAGPSYDDTEIKGKLAELSEAKEDKKNKVTSLSDESTDVQYPSAKCVHDSLSSLAEEMASNGQLIEDLQNMKIDRENDDYYPKMAVGLADNLAGVDVVDSEINFRRSGGGAITDGVARIETIKGNSVVWNQKINNALDTTGENGWWLRGSTQAAIDGNKIEVTTGTKLTMITQKVGFIADHQYLIACGFDVITDLEVSFQFIQSGDFNGNTQKTIGNITSKNVQYAKFYTASGNLPYLAAYHQKNLNAGDKTTLNGFKVIDLTQMFGSGNEPTTIAEFYKRIPMGVDLNAYNEGEVIHMDVQSIESQGANAWDEEWELGQIDNGTGEPVPSTGHIRSKNYIPVIAGATYYCLGSFLIIYYDEKFKQVDWWSVGGSRALTLPNNVHYVKLYKAATTYNHDICINLNDTAINGKYFPYIKRVEDLAVIRKYFPQGMKSAGTAHDEIRYNKASGKWEYSKGRLKAVNLGSLTWNYYSSSNTALFKAQFADIKIASSNDVANMLCAPYTANNANAWQGDKTIVATPLSGVQICIHDEAYKDNLEAFKAAIQGVILYYEPNDWEWVELDEADQFKDLDYQVWNAGTEKAIAEGKSAPLAADITYGFNAIGKIKELESLVAALRAKVGI